MIKYYTSSAYRKHYSDLEKLQLLDDTLEFDSYDLCTHVLKKPKEPTITKSSKSPSKNMTKSALILDPQQYFIDLIADLEVFKNITLTPIRVFKSLFLIHCCFLLIKTAPNDSNTDRFNDFFKWVLGEVYKLIQKSTSMEHKKRTSFFVARQDSLGKQKSKSHKDILKNFRSSRNLSPAKDNDTTSRPKSTGKYSTDEILSKEVCLLASIIKPYILYLQRILSIYSHYQSLLHSIPNTTESSQQSTWSILNIFKLQAPIIKNFSYIGRYFYKEYSPIVHFMMEFFSKEISRMYPKVYAEAKKKIQQVSHEWFVLLEKHSQFDIFYDEKIKIPGAENALLLIDQISKINDVLFYIYFCKYFYEMAKKLKLPEPRWFEINSKDCEFLIEYNEIKLRRTKRKSQLSQQFKKPSELITEKNISQQVPSVIVGENSSVLKCDLANQHIMVIEKKSMVPKIKNSLKIGGQKENKDKEDTITFRMKEFSVGLNESKNMGDHSFGGKDTENENAETLRARASKTHAVEV